MKWPPTISEVIEACEEHLAHLERQRKPRVTPQRLCNESGERPQGFFANLFVPENHPRYAKMAEWTKTAPHIKWWHFGKSSDGRNGVWIPRVVFEDGDLSDLRRA